MTSDTLGTLGAPAPAADPPSRTEQLLEQLLGHFTGQAAPAAPAPSTSTTQRVVAGAVAMAPPVQPDPEPPPAAPAAPPPHPGESFAPGEIGWHSYHDHRDPENVTRSQAVLVTASDADHVHGMVLGSADTLATFAQGTLTHDHPAAAAG